MYRRRALLLLAGSAYMQARCWGASPRKGVEPISGQPEYREVLLQRSDNNSFLSVFASSPPPLPPPMPLQPLLPAQLEAGDSASATFSEIDIKLQAPLLVRTRTL